MFYDEKKTQKKSKHHGTLDLDILTNRILLWVLRRKKTQKKSKHHSTLDPDILTNRIVLWVLRQKKKRFRYFFCDIDPFHFRPGHPAILIRKYRFRYVFCDMRFVRMSSAKCPSLPSEVPQLLFLLARPPTACFSSGSHFARCQNFYTGFAGG